MTVTDAPTTGPTTDPEVTPEQDPGEPTGDERQDEDEHQNVDGTYTAEGARILRDKNAKYRKRAKDAEARAETAEKLADERGRALFTARVTATGKLADPSDLEYSADLLDDDEALTAAVDELIVKRPHYAARRTTGSVGQGITGSQEPETSWLGRLKQGI